MDMLCVVTFQGIVKQINPAWKQILGYTLQEIADGHILQFVHPEDSGGSWEEWRKIESGAQDTVSFKNHYRCKDGSYKCLLWGLKAFRPEQRFFGIIRDITDISRLEEQFLQAQKMEAIGRLAGGIAHDFNNLLTAILGFANFLADDVERGNDWRDDVNEIRRAGLKASTLTHQLLAYSRRQVLQPKVMDINAGISDMEKMFRRILGEDIKCVSVFEPEPWAVRADSGQLQQALMNLVVNARDAMPNGGVLKIATQNIEITQPLGNNGFKVAPGAYVLTTVSDTGIGMDEAVKEHIFEPFFTTKEKGKGTGLGLAMVYGFVKQSGGYIDVRSVREEGTTFGIYLPQVKEEISADQRQVIPKNLRGTETVLVVDDDEAVRRLVSRILRKQGYAVFEAENARDALEFGGSHARTPQLLVVDIVLPDLNGMELTKRMSSKFPQVRTLFITGYLDEQFGEFVVGEETSILRKPFESGALLMKVRGILSGTALLDSKEAPETIHNGVGPLRKINDPKK